MIVRVTIDDPLNYTHPFNVTIPWALMPDTELIEDICEKERDSHRMTGR